MSFWRVLREDREAELERALCADSPHCAEPSTSPRTMPADDELEQARRTWVRSSRRAAAGQMRRTGWRFYQDPRGSHSSMPEYLTAYTGRITARSRRGFTASPWSARTALDIIRAYGRSSPRTLIYADPPYLGSLRRPEQGALPDARSTSMNCRPTRSTPAVLEALLDCRAAVVLSGYAVGALRRPADAAWFRREIAASRPATAAATAARVEVLWSNRPFPQGSLFDLEAS